MANHNLDLLEIISTTIDSFLLSVEIQASTCELFHMLDVLSSVHIRISGIVYSDCILSLKLFFSGICLYIPWSQGHPIAPANY